MRNLFRALLQPEVRFTVALNAVALCLLVAGQFGDLELYQIAAGVLVAWGLFRNIKKGT